MNTINLDLADLKANEWFGKINTNAVTDAEREYIDKLLTKIALNNVEDSVTFSDARLVFIASKMLISHSRSEVFLSEYGLPEFFIYRSYCLRFYEQNNVVRNELINFLGIWIAYLINDNTLTGEEASKMSSLAKEILSFTDNKAVYDVVPDFVITTLMMASKMEVGEVVAPIENEDIQDAGLEDREPEVKDESAEREAQIKELRDDIETFQFLIKAGATEEETKELEDALETFYFLLKSLGVDEEEETPPEPVKEEQEDLRDTLKKLGLTIMEQQVMEAFIKSLYAEPGFSDVDANDLSDATNITRKQIRGVLASLTKKGLIAIDTSGEYQIIYLDRDYWYLHPEWKNQLDDYAKGGRSRSGIYTITDDTGDAVVERADEEAVILFANTMFYYDTMDSGEEEIATLDEAISALKSMDYSVNNVQMGEGGKIGFEALANKVSDSYEGKKVPKKYQKQYGKTYSEEEADEVGNKVAAKVYRKQLKNN
jgi:hypothetical protein